MTYRIPAPLIIPLAALALTAGCAAPAYVSPVEITRFVGDGPTMLAQGTIELTAAPGTADTPEFPIYRQAVQRELEALGYQVVTQNGSQIAQLGLEQFVLTPDNRRGPVSVGGGGSVGGYGSGIGLGVGIDLTPPDPDSVETLVSVSIRAPEGGANLWEGRASMTATVNSDFADDTAAAGRMAQALFEGFPGTSGETIAVE